MNRNSRPLVSQSEYRVRVDLNDATHRLQRKLNLAIGDARRIECDRCEVICDRAWRHADHRDECEKLNPDTCVAEHLALIQAEPRA